ncbi:hypothetical protein ACHAWF_012199 [Thalassiosira exigua]
MRKAPTRRRGGRGSGRAMQLSAAAKASLAILSALDRGVGVGAASDLKNDPAGGLPQRRVRAAKRRVPYPEGHPLERHLAPNRVGDSLEEEEEAWADGDAEGGGSVVGGDGSRHERRRRQQQQRHQQRQQQQQQARRFLRFLSFQNPLPSPPSRRRRRRDAPVEEEPEVIQEGRLVETDRGDVLRYWTISGRSLADDAAGEGGGDAKNLYDDGSSSAQLLMDAEQIQSENVEAAAGNGEEDVPNAVDAGVVLDAAGNAEDVESSRDMTEDDNFDTKQYYLDPEASREEVQEGENEMVYEEKEDMESSLYQPMRLRAFFTDDETSGSQYLTPGQRRILMENIINPALFAWSKALNVVPVSNGKRRRMTGDDGDGKADGGGTLVVDQSQLHDGETCGPGKDSGLPSVRVPTEHLTEGLGDTDAVIYISVSFTDEVKPVPVVAAESSSTVPSLYHLHRGATGPKFGGSGNRRREGNWTSYEVDMSASVNNQTSAFPSTVPSQQPSFAPSEAEPLMAEDLTGRGRPTCTGAYLASATYCSSDQYDRPVAGMLSLCISDRHSFFHDPEQVKRNVITVMHEIGHVLGFNAHSLANFRDPDTGRPLTPRDSHGDVPDRAVTCAGLRPRTTSMIPLPSEEILKFEKVRGHVRTASIVTPTVQRIARNMFGCRTLVGAELESGEGRMAISSNGNQGGVGRVASPSAGECLGDHWSRRVFRDDLMNPMVDDVPFSLYISSLTLAYFADSGWYRVDTERIAPSSIWGRNAGCAFAEDKCITSNGHVTASNSPFFCNNFLEQELGEVGEEEEEEMTEIHGCDLGSSRKAMCSLVEYEKRIPEEYNYFAHDKYLNHDYDYGGSDPSLEFCPVFEGFANGRCDEEGSKKLMQVSGSLEVFGEYNSRCVAGSVDRRRTALCLPIACVIQERSLMIKVDGYWKACSYAGQIISVWWNPNDYVVCPDPSRMCPTFYCQKDCFREGGTCDYPTGLCMCATAQNSSDANSSSWFSSYHSYQRFEPCPGEHPLSSSSNGTFQVVERIDFELPEYYVKNTTVLLDDPRDFDDKVSRMFSQLNSGEVVGLVASFMMCAIFSYIIWSQLLNCYRRRILGASLSKVRSSVSSLSRMLRSTSRSSINDDESTVDSPPTHRRPRGGHNPQKDKMVASLLVHIRTESTALAEEEQQRRLQLGGLATASSDDDSDAKKSNNDSLSTAQTIVDLSSSSDEEVLVNRSELPPLPEGRVLAVVGARIVEDEINDDARSSVTTATQSASEFTSPLYQDDEHRRSATGGSMLRLRRHMG